MLPLKTERGAMYRLLISFYFFHKSNFRKSLKKDPRDACTILILRTLPKEH
jgi:hypothetical protein